MVPLCINLRLSFPITKFQLQYEDFCTSLLGALILSCELEKIFFADAEENTRRECNCFERELDQVPFIICVTRQLSTDRRTVALEKDKFKHVLQRHGTFNQKQLQWNLSTAHFDISCSKL
jgi:hypothetical protein